MPLAYDQSLISASSSSGFQIDVLPEGHHPSGPPALIDPDDLPADPKHAVWALAAAQHHPQKRLPQKSSFTTFKNVHSHSPHGPPTVSTFSASNIGHIHIVQPYLPNASAEKPNSADPAGESTTLSHGCSTSTFSVHPTSASTPYSFSNPYCTNQLHSLIPGVGAGPGGPGQPPRPANAWILYRSDKMKDITPSLPGQPKPPQADISKLIAAMWKNEKPEVKQHYEALSDMKKAEHLALYPGYRFQPMKKADKEKARAERKAEKEKERLAAAVKGHRRLKSKRATTEETVATEENDAENPQEHHPQQQGYSTNPDAMSPLSPTRMRTFTYQPYSVPSPGPTSPTATFVGAIPKRKRARTKVEAPAPVLPSGDQTQVSAHFFLSFFYCGAPECLTSLEQPDYVTAPQHSVPVTGAFFEHHGDGGMATEYSPGVQNGHSTTPQLSSGSNSDPNSHPTPPYTTVHPSVLSNSSGTPPNALSATLESVGGQHDIFQFANFDAANLLNNPGAEIEFTLPQDYPFDLMDGLGLGLDDSGLGFESSGMGFAEFSNMASTGQVEGLQMGFNDHVLTENGNLVVDPRALAYGPSRHESNISVQYVDGYGVQAMEGSSNHTQPGPTPNLEISTNGMCHVSTGGISVPPSTVSEQFGIGSPLEALPPGDHTSSYYGSFAASQHYAGGEQYHLQQNQHYYTMHGYTSSQGYTQHPAPGFMSPTHSFASPPPPSALDDGSITGTPTGDVYVSSPGTARGPRGAAAPWR